MNTHNNRRGRSFSRSRSRSRSSKHHRNNKHDRSTANERLRSRDRSNYHGNNDRTHRTHRTNTSKSRSYYSNSNSNAHSRSRSRSPSPNKTSHSHSPSPSNQYRENADLPSDHPLFSIVKHNKQKQQLQQQNNKSPSPHPHPHPHTHSDNTHTNYQNNHRSDRKRYHRERGDRDRHRGRYRERERDRDRYGDMDRDRERENESERGHSYHTGHKQQVLNRRKEKEIEPQITSEQAQQIIAVTTIVQQQEEISSIVETQQRKLAQKTSLEKIKEKILLQKQQMIARKNKMNNIKTVPCTDHMFEAEVVMSNQEALPNMTQMMINKSSDMDMSIKQRQAIENLAVFVSDHGIALEQTVRDRSKNDPTFSWLYDEQSNGYKYYQYLLEQKQQISNTNTNTNTTPIAIETANANVKKRKRRRFSAHPSTSISISQTDTNTDTDTDNINISNNSNVNVNINKKVGGSLDKMNAYINKLEADEKCKKDERFAVSNQMSIFNGGPSHHIGHYLPKNELNKFNNKYAAHQPLRYTNKGHAILKKLGWNEGKGLGKNEQGQTKPVSSMIKKKNEQQMPGTKPWDPTPGDNQYDLYKKKMMLSYRYRPNPLGNPRKDYY